MPISYPNLPGIEVTLRDGGLILPEEAATQRLLIIAPTTKTVGPDLAAGNVPENPVLIRSTADLAANNFGTFVENGKLNQTAAAWKRAFDGGNRRTYLLGVNHGVTFVDADAPTAQEKDDAYKALFLKVHEALFGILQDFEVDHIVLVDMFADEITVELTAADFGVTAEEFAELPGIVAVTTTTDDGAGGTITTTTQHGNFAQALADYCEAQTINNNAVLGYVGTTAPATNGLADIKTHVDTLSSMENDYSGHVSVIAGPELGYAVPGLGTLHYANGAVTYAALVSTLRAESAPTNKAVYGVSAVSYNLSLRQLNALSGNKLVSFRVKNNAVYVTDGITTAPDFVEGNVTRPSDYTRLSTLRITQAAISLVREIADPFIGEPNGMPQRNALNAAIRSGLEAMKSAGAIADYRFSVVSTPRQTILGQATVTLELIPALEMRKISVDISLRPMFDGTEQA